MTPWLQPTSFLCPWNFPGKNTRVGYHFLLLGIFLAQGSNPCLLHCKWNSSFPGGWVIKNPPAVQEFWVWSLGPEDSLEKEMVTYSSILAWRIPWTEEPGRLQFMGSQRVEYDWRTYITTSCLKHFSTLQLAVAKWPSSSLWNVSRHVIWKLLGSFIKRRMMYALYLFLGSCPHSLVWNMDASNHAVSESQCSILGLVIEYC